MHHTPRWLRVSVFFCIIVALLVGGFFFINKNQSNNSSAENFLSNIFQKQTSLVLPSVITRIDRLLFHSETQELFFVAEKSNGNHGVWSYDGKIFEERLNVTGKFYAGHLFEDNKGNLYYSSNSPSKLFRSSDHGKTWDVVLEYVDVFWAMTDAGNGVLYGSLWSHNLPAVYQSTDQGKSWHLWKNFHDVFPEDAVVYAEGDNRFRMRHLHDVVAIGESLFVGTGDMARATLRSGDGGESWEKIWDEGFTAHIYDRENKRLFVGADLREGKGIALYEFGNQRAEDVWVPSQDWMGYIYSMIEKKPFLLAATHIENNESAAQRLYGILFSKNGTRWEEGLVFESNEPYTTLFLADGPGNVVYMSREGELFEVEVNGEL